MNRFTGLVASAFVFLSGIPAALAQAPSSVRPGDEETASTLWSVLVSGGWFMLPLAGLLFLGTLLVFIYLLTIRRGAVVSDRYLDACEVLLRKRDFRELLAISNRRSEAVAQVVQEMLAFAKDNPTAGLESIREIAETEGIRQASSLNHRITYLADVGTIAPMVGLLGTVSGMIHSFGALATDIATSKPMMLAHGVSEALVCTASGLVVGIFAFSFYSYFRGRVQRLTADLEAASTQIMALFTLYWSARDHAGGGAPVTGVPRRREREREHAGLDDEF